MLKGDTTCSLAISAPHHCGSVSQRINVNRKMMLKPKVPYKSKKTLKYPSQHLRVINRNEDKLTKPARLSHSPDLREATTYFIQLCTSLSRCVVVLVYNASTTLTVAAKPYIFTRSLTFICSIESVKSLDYKRSWATTDIHFTVMTVPPSRYVLWDDWPSLGRPQRVSDATWAIRLAVSTFFYNDIRQLYSINTAFHYRMFILDTTEAQLGVHFWVLHFCLPI